MVTDLGYNSNFLTTGDLIDLPSTNLASTPTPSPRSRVFLFQTVIMSSFVLQNMLNVCRWLKLHVRLRLIMKILILKIN